MTETVGFSEQPDRLWGSLQVLNAITAEAMVCATNHAYYQAERGLRKPSKPILLLDFDLIAATLRPAMQVISPEVENPLEIPSDPAQLAGPHTVRFALRQLESYALPPGAMVELLRRRSLLRQRLSDRGNNVLRTVHQALDSDKPVTSIDESGIVKSLAETVIHELREFGTMYDDLDLLEDVLRRATPLEDLLGKRPAQSDPVFEETRRVLSMRRPKKKSSNELDALNVAFVVWMFLSPKEGLRRQVPLLISDTRAMEDFSVRQSLLSLPQPSELQVFNRGRFLLLDSQISNFSGGRDDLIVVKANRLAHETQQLAAHVMQTMRAVSGLEEGDNLTRLECNKLDNQFGRYRTTWGRLLDPLWRYPALDHVSHFNATWMPRVEQAAQGLEARVGAAQFRDRLASVRSAFSEAIESDRRVQLILNGAGSIADVVDDEGAPSPFFEIGIVVGSAAKTLLSELSPGVPIRDFRQEILGSQQSLRIAVTGSPYFRRGEAIFVADIGRAADQVKLTVVWTHNQSLRELAHDVAHFGSVFFGPGAENIEFVAFGKSGESREPLRLTALLGSLGEVVSRFDDLQLFELRSETTAAFADVEPLVGVERQIGIAAPLDWWSERMIIAVNELMVRTCHGGIPPQNARVALRDVVRIVGERTQRAAA
jgi:hypothetical protein